MKTMCHGLSFKDSLEKSETDSRGRSFLEIIMFMGQKLTKLGQFQTENLSSFLAIT